MIKKTAEELLLRSKEIDIFLVIAKKKFNSVVVITIIVF